MPARVLMFCPSLTDGGADRVVVKLLRHFDRARFAPTLALLHRDGPLVADVPDDVPIHVLGASRLARAVAPLSRLIHEQRPDIVFSTHGAANIIVAIAHTLARSSSRLVLSERSAVKRSDRSFARVVVELPAKRWTYRRAAIVTAVSRGVARDLADVLHVPLARIRVVYNPMVDADLIAAAAQPAPHPWFDSSAKIPVILAVGRLVEIKDYPTLLDAFALISNATPARLAILGDGPLRASVEGHAHALGLSDRIVFLGFDKNPFKYMAKSRMLLHASRAEGLPGALIQAMACGTPVVSTDCDYGPREVITNPGHDGFLAPVGDSRALSRCALQLLRDATLRDQMSRAAKSAVAKFSTADAMSRYEAALMGEPDR